LAAGGGPDGPGSGGLFPGLGGSGGGGPGNPIAQNTRVGSFCEWVYSEKLRSFILNDNEDYETLFFMHLMTKEMDSAVEALDKFILECYKQGIRGANKLRGVCRMLREYRAPEEQESNSGKPNSVGGSGNPNSVGGSGNSGNPNSGGNLPKNNVKQEPGGNHGNTAVKQEPGASARNSRTSQSKGSPADEMDLPSLITRTAASPSPASASKPPAEASVVL
jgi:hypothetical protein